MRITPYNNIAINGRHCPAGVPIEVTDQLGRDLIAQRIAARAPAAPALAPAPAATETAALAAPAPSRYRAPVRRGPSAPPAQA